MGSLLALEEFDHEGLQVFKALIFLGLGCDFEYFLEHIVAIPIQDHLLEDRFEFADDGLNLVLTGLGQ